MGQNLGKLIKTFGGRLTTFFSFVTSLVGFIRLVQGDVGLLTTVLLAVGIGVLLLTCAYVYFKRATIGSGLHNVAPTKRPTYGKKARHFALVGLFVVPLLVVLGVGGWQYHQALPTHQVIIAVADFEGPQPQNYRVTETILEQLREATENYDDVKVKALNEAITAQQGSDVARKKGKQNKASIVLWGWYGKTADKVRISTHFEVLQEPRYLSLWQDKQTLNTAVANLESEVPPAIRTDA